MLFGTINFKIAALAGVTFSLCCFMPTYATSSANEFKGEECDVLHHGLTFLRKEGKKEKVIAYFPGDNTLAFKKNNVLRRDYKKVSKDIINLHKASIPTQITDEISKKWRKKGYKDYLGIRFTAPNLNGDKIDWTFYAKNEKQRDELEQIIIDGINLKEKKLNAHLSETAKKFYEDLEKELEDGAYNLDDTESLRFPMQSIMNKQYGDIDVKMPCKESELFLKKFNNLKTEESKIDFERYALWHACLQNNIANKRYGNQNLKLKAGWVPSYGACGMFTDAFTKKTQKHFPKPAPPAADKQHRAHMQTCKGE